MNNKKVYLVVEDYDEDGGFGDAVTTQIPQKVFLNKEKAEKYVKENSNPRVYASPYADLYSGGLEVIELDLIK